MDRQRLLSIANMGIYPLIVLFPAIIVVLSIVLVVDHTVLSDRMLEIVSILGGLVLSWSVLSVYADMSNTQDDELEILKGQYENIEDYRSPHVVLHHLKFSGEDRYGPRFSARLSNLGSGPAKNLELNVTPTLLEGFNKTGTPDSSSIEAVEADDWKLCSKSIDLFRREEAKDDTTLITRGNYLEKDETKQDFDFTLSFEVPDEGLFREADSNPRVAPSEIVERATYDKNVSEDHDLYSEFSRYKSYDSYFRDSASATGLGKAGYSQETLRELASTLPFRYLQLDFSLTYDGLENPKAVGTLIALVSLDVDEGEMWCDCLEYSQFETKYVWSDGPDPLVQRKKLRESEVDSN